MKIVLQNRQAPGDIISMSAVVRDLAIAQPKWKVGAFTSFGAVWDNNPHISLHNSASGWPRDAKILKLEYGSGITEQNFRPVHFSSYWHELVETALKIKVPMTLPRPSLFLSDEERKPMLSGRYWLVISGGKNDMPAKVWSTARLQEVVWQIRDMGLGVVQVGEANKKNWQPELEGVLDLRGKTTLRDIFQLLHGAEGAICGITMLMHAAAGLEKPCVCIAGGREAWWWEAYVRENAGLPGADKLRIPHRYLHTIGLLDCCNKHGCWRSKLYGDKPQHLCKYPILKPGQVIPKCLDMIEVSHVMAAVRSYYEDNTLPPIVPSQALPEVLIPPKLSHKSASGVAVVSPGPIPRVRDDQGPIDDPVFDHPTIGGRFTVCVLCYGDYAEMHKRCLGAILRTVPQHRLDLRVGTNVAAAETRELINHGVRDGSIRKHYEHTENDRKYPVMREMFHDPSCPIGSQYTIWLDDDTFTDIDPTWLVQLARTIIKQHPHGNRLFGPLKAFQLKPDQLEWAAQAGWYRKRLWQDRQGMPRSAGRMIRFAVGAFWAVHSRLIQECDIPDVRIGHNGGDYLIAAQVWQGGHGVGAFSTKKDIVAWSAEPRRGITEPHSGMAGNAQDT